MSIGLHQNMNILKTLMKIQREYWIALAAIIMVIFITVNRMNVFDTPNVEGLSTSTGVSSTNQVSSSIPMGDVYTMINTVTEPDGTIVTDTLDTEGNYVTTVFNSSSMQANQGGGGGGGGGGVAPGATNPPTTTETPAPTVRVITLDRDVASY